MQFYAPGFAPFVDNESCDNTHWCASLHINDLECTLGFQSCNNNCIEPTNFAFIQTNGVPTGPPSPQLATAASFTPNENTLLMNPGDRLKIHIWDARLPGGGHALETSIKDLTTGKSGFMIASAKNGFMQTSITDCSGTPFNYQPEYSTAKKANIIPWAALETNISTQFEIGHFEPCTSVQNPMPITLGTFHDTIWQDCTSPYESTTMPDGKPNPEISDAPCWPKGFTHGGAGAAQPGGGLHPDHRPERRPGLRRHVLLGRLAEQDDAQQLAVAVPPDAAADPRPRIPADPVPDERRGERGELQARPASAARFLLRAAPGSSTRGGRRPG